MLNKLKPNSKWGDKETEAYINKSLSIFDDQIDKVQEIVDDRLEELFEECHEESEVIRI